ncbi:hypothetical protein DPMN_175820 [Dreissena polymorpha]|uniref:Uncharacterized protein n=1 Tax=Dreissena polymorpha TaxID=45954 RepID=A0A9D4IJZ4_DREPO|nr:hypothetical protein DPMN_175820 [Dreissena polymorpha]
MSLYLDAPLWYQLIVDLATACEQRKNQYRPMVTVSNSFKQTVQTQMRGRIMRRLIWIYAVCQGLFSRR